MNNKTVFITGGSTGGHLYPALCLGRELRAAGWSVIYIVKKGWMNREIFDKEGFEFRTISGEGFPRRPGIKMIVSVYKLFMGIMESLLMLMQLRPAVVIGMGSYISFPIVFTAWLSFRKVIIHEQNVKPGLANRLLAFFADRIAVAFSSSVSYFPSAKVRVTGNPIRREITCVQHSEGIKYFDLSMRRQTVLVFGGSQGAQRINQVFCDSIDLLGRKIGKVQFIHITGIASFSQFREMYKNKKVKIRVIPFLRHMEYAYASSDLVISRAGGSTLSEMMACGLPSILIPYPYATEDHQYHNAKYLADRGASVMIEEKHLTPAVLADILLTLLNDRTRLKNMGENAREKPDASRDIVRLIDSL